MMTNFKFFSGYLQTTDTNFISGYILQAKWRGIIEELLQERDVIFSDDVLAVHARHNLLSIYHSNDWNSKFASIARKQGFIVSHTEFVQWNWKVHISSRKIQAKKKYDKLIAGNPFCTQVFSLWEGHTRENFQWTWSMNLTKCANLPQNNTKWPPDAN